MTVEVYLTNIDQFLAITAQDFRMLMSLCRISQKSNIYLNTQIRLGIMNDMAMKSTHFSNCLNRLKKLGFLSGSRYDYKLTYLKVSEVEVPSIKFIVNILNK